MAARQKNPGKAPLHSVDAIGRSFHPTGFCSSLTEEEQAATESPGYVLEWNGYTCGRRSLEDGRALRTEIIKTKGLGERLIVVRRLEDQKQQIFQTLNELAGIGKHLLESHLGARGYHSVGRSGREGRERGRWWSWEYPEMGLGRVAAYNSRMASPGGLGSTPGPGGSQEVLFCRVSLWVTTNLSILLLDAPTMISDGRRQMVNHVPPRLKHQDAATTVSTLRSPSSYGTVEDECIADDLSPGTLEKELWGSMGHDAFLEETLGELAYSHWLRFLETVGPSTSKREALLLWDALKSLERNLDDSKNTELRNETPPASPISSAPSSDCTLPSPDDWKDLISRTQHRLYLLQQPQIPQQQLRPSTSEQPGKDLNERALDRIAYIGGLLLPMTVISSVLAIEGTYGPEGDKFWVFWVVSVVASLVAVGIIYVERLRRLQVWFEIAADAVMETGGALTDEAFGWGEEEDKKEEEDVRVVRDGNGVKAWKKGELGWGGAVKKASGYYRWRGDSRLRFDIPKSLG